MATEIHDDIKEELEGGGHTSSILTSKMAKAVEGIAWRKSMKNGVREVDEDELTDRAMRAEKSLRNAVKQGIQNPAGVLKGLNQTFLQEHAGYLLAGPSNPAIAQLQDQVAQISADLGKNFTTASPLSTGLVPFDLEAPSRLIYWFETPLRSKIAREKGSGTSHRVKTITGVSGSQTPSGSGGIVDISTPEITNFGSWPASLPGAGTQTSVDLNIPYRFLGLSESLSWLAQFAGQGFEDISSLANLILMQEMHFGEEYMTIAGTSTALSAPTVSLATRVGGSNETAVTGFTTSVWVRVTTRNYYGETVASTVQSVSPNGTTQVVDVTITPPANNAGQQYSVYVGSGVADPGRAATWFSATLGGTKYTLQGAVPTSGAVPPAADSGTFGAGRYDGLLSVLSGHATAGSVYPAGWQGGYFNGNVRDTLNLNVLNTALQQVYDGPGAFRASPTELLCEGFDAKNLSQDVAKNSSGTNYQLLINQDQTAGVIHGTAVSQVVNPVTRRLVDVTVHPGWLQGTAVLNSYSTPSAARNSNVWEMRMVQDLMTVTWPVIDPTYRYSAFEYGTLVAQAPQYCALLGGLQASATNPFS